MAAQLSDNMTRTLINLARAGSVPAMGTIAQNKAGCTANGLSALQRRGLVEIFRTGEIRKDFEGNDYPVRAYRITDVGRAVLVRLP